jgi:predicted O-linked N-acetylglucosamine transferase (SPINDLY family)
MREDDKEQVRQRLRAGKRLVAPFTHRSIFDSEEEHLILARLRAQECPPSSKPLWRGERYAHEKIRIAYISPDFRGHVVGRVIVDFLERHDKARFETTAISHGHDDGSSTRKRLEAAFDRFVDAQKISDAAAANLLRDLEIDIAIDLAGYTQGGRNKIFALRPAPVPGELAGLSGNAGDAFYGLYCCRSDVDPS